MIVNSAANDTYGWSRCYDEMTDDDEMTDAAAIVNAADPDALVIYSGLNYDHKLNPITAKLPLSETDPRFFDLADFDYADNIVFELHTYDNWMTNCTFFQSKLCSRGFHALDMSAESTSRNIFRPCSSRNPASRKMVQTTLVCMPSA
ncbi:hypothetical protein VDGD_03701 [Verticillium dahliae]|nr:hypothetical protein VDGD_03701 [Verticillium dahliae]